ncbi:unnamed protein product [Euphydryas editha]|uniref:Transposase n=1 Tax=Euphydryas editha TaxID=104508 RepID=A0AAU9TVQ1_EUPED|nr:unnamed protein product [Euphydryas editha]
MLTALQKQARVDTCKEFLQVCGDDPASVFERIVTGETINAEKYSTTLRRLREAIKERRRRKLAKNVLLLHDNASVHISRLFKAAVRVLVRGN